MQVKKFEARTMKEALEMVKTQLGPDAIILSAKELTKTFGLAGDRSIEITAAYSESTLHQKKFVESKFQQQDKEKFQKSTAKNQKQVMEKMIEAQLNKMNPPPKAAIQFNHKFTERKYIDIDNEEQQQSQNMKARPMYSSTVVTPMPTYQEPQPQSPITQVAQKAWDNMEVNSLKQQIESLKQVITNFKTLPQNFVASHPGSDYGVNYILSPYFEKLAARGLQPEIAAEILMKAQVHLSPDKLKTESQVKGWIAKFILDSTEVVQNTDEKFQLFIGPTGSGKTSMLIKMASDLLLNQKKKIALITTDSSKVGASEQMKIFSQILNVPFLTIKSPSDWGLVLTHIDQIDHVLVDFAGLTLKTEEELHYIEKMTPPGGFSIRKHLVLSALSQESSLEDVARRYAKLKYDDIIFTNLDMTTTHGSIYNYIRKHKKPLFAFGIGPQVPEDMEYATPERMVDLILQITQQNTAQEMGL